MKNYRLKFTRLLALSFVRFIRLPLLRHWASRREMVVLAYLNNNEILLDGGCGNGVHSKNFPSKSKLVIGLDLVGHDLVEYRRNVKGETSCVKASLEFLPFLSECFSGVVLQDVLEHVNRPLSVLKQIKKVLKPGGELLITVPNWYNRFFDLNPYTVKLHHSFHSSIGWKKLLEEAGFKVCIIRAIAFPIINFNFLVKHLHFFGIGVFLKAKKPIKSDH